MNNFIVGKREALNANSSKYGYCLEGMCVKTTSGGYRSHNGTMVNTAVSTDASCLVKEAVYLHSVGIGEIIVFDRAVCKVMEVCKINDITARFKLFNLESGEISEQIVDTKDRIVSTIWDTFDYPNKKVEGGVAAPALNEFTPAQLRELRQGKTTLEALRTPAQADTLETVLTDIVKGIIQASGAATAQG